MVRRRRKPRLQGRRRSNVHSCSSSNRRPGGQRHRLPAVPVLRQSPEVPGLRQHLQREVRRGAPGRPRARDAASDAPRLPPVRCRHGRRHRARAADAPRPCAAPHRAAAGGGQGDQPRGRAARPREDARPLRRTSGHRAGADEPQLRRGAAPAAARRAGRRGIQLAGSAPHRHVVARLRRADRGAAFDAGLRLADASFGQDRQSRLRPPDGARDLSRRSQVPARRRDPEAGSHRRELRLHPRPRSRGALA